jgi:hypothetical protein
VKRVSAAAFLALLLAALGGLVVAQRLRRSEPVVFGVKRTVAFSPIGTGPRTATISFYLRRSDTVAVGVVDLHDDEVRLLTAGRSVAARQRIQFTWDGRDRDGRIPRNGTYRFRIGLARQGRSLTLPEGSRLDTFPARPWIGHVGPGNPAAPFILPNPVKPVGRLGGSLGHSVVGLVLSTSTVPSKVVKKIPLKDFAREVPWDGTIGGHPAPDGIYMLGVSELDGAGNPGTFPPFLGPVPGPVRGRPGVTVRHLALAPPVRPVAPGSVAAIPVDARGQRVEWGLRSVPSGRLIAHGMSRGSRVRVRVPASAGGLQLASVVGNGRRMEVPLCVNRGPRRVLVVLPAIRWQGVASVDSTGQGLPDTLPRSRTVLLGRLVPPLPGGLEGLHSNVVPLIRQLSRANLPFELTTDIALAEGVGPKLKGHSGVILAGEETWLPKAQLVALRDWVSSGGRLLDLGTDGLLKTVEVTGGVASRPSHRRRLNPFEAAISPRSADAAGLLVWKDRLGLFAETGGRVDSPPGWTRVAALGPHSSLLSAAGPAEGVAATAAWKFGKGIVIRPGIPLLAKASAVDNQSAGLLHRAVIIVSSRG